MSEPNQPVPGVRLLRTSERSSFKTCRQRWAWGYRERLKTIETGPALRFGDLVHRALAPYYKPGTKRGPHPAKTFEKLYHADAKKFQDEGFSVYTDETWEDALPLGIAMLEGYVETFAAEDEQFKVLSSEQVFQVPLKVWIPANPSEPEGDDGYWFRFKYVGTVDGVWQDRASGRVFFKEFKTAAQVKLVGLALDEQAGGYWTYAPKLLTKQKKLKPSEAKGIDHILYTFLRKAAPNPDWHLDAMGRKLNKPDAKALREQYVKLGRNFPKKGTGKNGAVLVNDMIEDLGEKAWEVAPVSEVQPAPFFVREKVYRAEEDRRNVHRRVLNEMKDMVLCEQDPDRIYKNPGPLHMPNCMGCDFRDMCELHETGNDYEAYRDASYTTWSPYSQHELPERW